MPKSPQQIHSEGLEEFEALKCVNGAMYWGCVDDVCDCGDTKCNNQQTLEMAEKEYKHFLTTLTINQLRGIEEWAKSKRKKNQPVKDDAECIEKMIYCENRGYNQALTDLITHIQENINAIENPAIQKLNDHVHNPELIKKSAVLGAEDQNKIIEENINSIENK